MGYGGLPNFTEFDAAGHVLLDGTLGRNVQDFRTYLAPWSAQPTRLAGGRRHAGRRGTLSVSVSWNGATDVACWRVLAGASAASLAAVATAPRAASRRRSRPAPPALTWPCRRWTPPGTVIGTSAPVKG